MYRRVVTIYNEKWLLYVTQSGHYMYRKLFIMYRKVVIICTAKLSLYVTQSGHYMYCTVVTICTAKW